MAPPQVDGEYRKQITSAHRELGELISKNKHYAPLMLHLALHDAGIYGFQTGGTKYYLIKRGPNGSIRTPKELGHPCNKGLQEAVDICEPVKNKHKKITYADLYQLAGVAAVEETGGPKIEFVPGREDSVLYPEEGRLPDNEELDESLLEKITKRMGLEEKEMVALFGGLHQWNLPVESSAENVQEQTTPDGKKAEFKFGNSYFWDLLLRKPNNLLLKGERFRKWVETFAQNVEAFLKDYGAAHKKVSELGLSREKAAHKKVSELGLSREKAAQGDGGTQTDQNPSASRNRVRLVQGIGIAVVTTAIILGFFLSRRSK